MKNSTIQFDRYVNPLLLILGCLGIIFRFVQITKNNFVYYDEGLYLDYFIDFLYHVEKNPAQSISDFLRYLNISFHLSLLNPKPLWFFLTHLRVYLFGAESWFYTKMLSAIFGSLTVCLSYLFAKKLTCSKRAACLTFAVLALLPSHLYYSRLGMQEALSTFCFLAGMYFYLFPRTLSVKSFVAGLLLACVYFTNYRMIVIPLIVVLVERFLSWSEKKKFEWKHFGVTIVTFTVFVVVIGMLDKGANAKITWAWMTRQATLAEGHFSFLNLFSYPLYLGKCESIFFALFFFANIEFVRKKEFGRLLPFGIVILQMVLFSFVQEKGVRYLCVVTPFMALAVAGFVDYFLNHSQSRNWNVAVGGMLVVMLLVLGFESRSLSAMSTDYETSMVHIDQMKRGAKVLSSQPLVTKMFAQNKKAVKPLPKSWNELLKLRAQGYRYLIVDPQVYISYTDKDKRFNFKLIKYLNFITTYVKPIATYPHFNKRILERFVLEHNEDIIQSLHFLSQNKEGKLGVLRVYDIEQCLLVFEKMMKTKNKKSDL